MQKQSRVMYYDGSGEVKHIVTKETEQCKMVITPEIRKNLGGNPYLITK